MGLGCSSKITRLEGATMDGIDMSVSISVKSLLLYETLKFENSKYTFYRNMLKKISIYILINFWQILRFKNAKSAYSSIIIPPLSFW